MKEILVAFDFSRYSQRALQLALQGQPFGLEANLRVVHVLDPALYETTLPGRRMPSTSDIERFLRAEVAKASAEGGPVILGNIRYEVVTGDVVSEIAARMRSAAFDGLLIGGQGHGGLAERVLGTTARRILRQSFAPTYIVKNQMAVAPLRRALCAIDLREATAAVLHAAESLALRFSCSFDTLSVGIDESWPYELHVGGPLYKEVRAAQARAQAQREDAMRSAEIEILGRVYSHEQAFAFGSPAKTIARRAEAYDVVLLGAHKGMTPFGSVLTGVLELSPADVLVAR